MPGRKKYDVAIVGAGLAGIATAYYLTAAKPGRSVLLIDRLPPMSFTSTQSGDNYRNWWPHPIMRRFTDASINLMERIAHDSSNVINMNRRGYAIATRRNNIENLVADLHAGYEASNGEIRFHDQETGSYSAATEDWEHEPTGVDVLSNQALIRQTFPSLVSEIRHVLHIRRAGDISGQSLGQFMLDRVKASGGSQLRGDVAGITGSSPFRIDVETANGPESISADTIVNAAGPFVNDISGMLGVELPITNVFQQKILFEDTFGAVPRDCPFVIDIDEQILDWTDEERALLAEDAKTSWITQPISGGAHCRPDGGENSHWVKLGWAYNTTVTKPLEDVVNDPRFDSQFPEIVMRGASRLIPALGTYVESFPGRFTHYGGYYTMTRENWPLIGPLEIENTYIVGALSGFGTMAACSAGQLCAAWVDGESLPDYAKPLSLERYNDDLFIKDLQRAANKGVL